ncbi:TolB family protein [Streptomyces erythrochromogenes]|uniref:TolB family protein n=1 Tax=Streptomyces erythrochromogenes TaxID=285574 RepID=UPI0036F84CC3
MNRTRTASATALLIALLGSAAATVAWRAATTDPGTGTLHLTRPDTLVVVDANGTRVHQKTRQGTEIGTGPDCRRAAVAAGTLVCLHALPGPFSSEVRIYRPGKTGPEVTLPVWGNPSRARVSPTGHLVAWTVFRSGDSYAASGQFSTTAGIYDLRNGDHYGSLEDFTVLVDGERTQPDDRNFWGITFAADDRTFYATMSANGRTHLMRGDLTTRELTTLRTNVECPSLSPDETRIAYKKRVGADWQLHVLHLQTGQDTALAAPPGIDDQAAWLDDTTVAYGRTEHGRPFVYAVPADGSGKPVELTGGRSPSITTTAR